MSIQPKYGKLSPEQQAIADELFGDMPIYKPERPAMNMPQITKTGRPMSNIDKQALVIPQREKHDWSQAVMRNCDFCQQWALTVRHSDGGCICASCCDSEYTTALSSALVVALDELEANDKSISFLKDQLAQLANFNPDWDMLEAATYSLREHMAELTAARKRIAELEATQGKPVMFIDGDISSADADKLAAVIREFNEETETPAARMARIIRENPHPTNMCDMPAAAAGKGE